MNRLFSLFILLAISVAVVRTFTGGPDVMTAVSAEMFRSAGLAVEVCLGLIGVLTLWSGLFRIAEQARVTERVASWVAPVLTKLMPQLGERHPAHAPVVMNLSANMLGLDNAATPLGLKAMEALQQDNKQPDRATNAQIMFLVLNTSSVTLIPVTVFMYRAQQGAADPADVYLPMLMATSASTLAGIWITARYQGIKLLQPLLMGVLAAWAAVLGLLTWVSLNHGAGVSSVLGNGLLLAAVAWFLLAGMRRGIPVYEVFIEGARDGFTMAVKLIPYLVAMLVAISMLRAAGALDLLLAGIAWLVSLAGMDTRFVDALPVAFLKPLTGSGARAMMIEVMQQHGVDSLAGRMAAVMQGSTETTFYVLAVYFGSAGITRVRHAIICGLAADSAGLVTAILATYLFFG